jgi:hypothetical protein
MQKNERLFRVVYSALATIKDSIQSAAYKIVKLHDPELAEKFSKEDLEITYFKKSQVEFSRDRKEVEILTDSLELVTRLINSAEDILKNSKLINKDKFMSYILNNLQDISEDMGSLVREDFEKLIQEYEKSEDGGF